MIADKGDDQRPTVREIVEPAGLSVGSGQRENPAPPCPAASWWIGSGPWRFLCLSLRCGFHDRITLAQNSRQVEIVFLRAINGDVVAGVSVAHNARRGIVPQNTFYAVGRIVGAVAADRHACVL